MKQVIAVISLIFLSTLAFAQSPAQPAASKPANVKPAPIVAVSKPAWADLTAPQQQALKPLATTWNNISEPQKRKWLEVSKNYPALLPADQATMHSRMNEWVTMSPQDRAAARLNFAKTKELSKQLTPDEKKAKWETYKALSPEEKAKLVEKAPPKPTGAATAVKPVPTQKLAVTPKPVPPLASLPSAPSAPLAPKAPKTSPPAAVTTPGDTLQNVVSPPAKSN